MPAYFTENIQDDYFQAHRINSSKDKIEHFKNFETDFINEIESIKNNYEYFIITSEHFHSRLTEISQIQKLKNFLSKLFSKIYIIAYFRNQQDAVISYYSTSLKTGNTSTFDEFIKKFNSNTYYFNYLDIANNWSDIIKLKI